MSIRSTINKYKRYIKSLNQASGRLENRYQSARLLLDRLQVCQTSQEGFFGRNEEEFLLRISDASERIQMKIQSSQRENQEAIEARVEYLWRRIDALEEMLEQD